MHAKQAYDELKQKLLIDEMQLDQELMQFPMDLQTVSEFCAEAIQLREASKRDLELTKALASVKLRNDDDRISEAKILSLLPLDQELQEAQDRFNDATYDAALWQSLVTSYSEKGTSVRRICEMMLAGYLTPSSVYEQRKEEMNRQRAALRPNGQREVLRTR